VTGTDFKDQLNETIQMRKTKKIQEKWFRHRDDLTGEHAFGDAGQMIFALFFFVVWVGDSFFLRYTTQLNEIVPPVVSKPVGIVFLCLAAYCSCSGLRIVFGEVRKTPSIIRKGVFGLIRHPIYFSEVLLYLGLFMLRMSLAAGVVCLGAMAFLYFLSRYEERLLIKRFGNDYSLYMRDVGMWIPRIYAYDVLSLNHYSCNARRSRTHTRVQDVMEENLEKTKRIALVAHDKRKPDLLDWFQYIEEALSKTIK
jgi:protein-S-isoprenylcysteine O-methyltransferase Ste14